MRAFLVFSVVLIEAVVQGQIRTPAGMTPARVIERRKVNNGEEIVVALEDSFLDQRGQRTAYVDPIPCVITQRIGNRVAQIRSECLPRVSFANLPTTDAEFIPERLGRRYRPFEHRTKEGHDAVVQEEEHNRDGHHDQHHPEAERTEARAQPGGKV